ncbi:MAG: hypothetical protein J5546_07145 [Lachnospiraceae bacterium]|nr:hypothetical protein [Lachnospiraceae bacterium]
MGGAGGAGGAGNAVEAGTTAGSLAMTVRETGKKLPLWAWILIGIAMICVVLPALISFLGGLAGVLTGVVVSWFAILISVGAVAFSMFVVAIVLVVVGAMCAFGHPFTGVLLIGVAMLFAFLGMLFLMATVWMGGKATPWICEKCIGFFKYCWNGTKKLFAKIH